MRNSILTPEGSPVFGRYFRTANHFSHDGIVLKLPYGWGAIAMGGENRAPECEFGGMGGGRFGVVE
jgi:hypothetical protein